MKKSTCIILISTLLLLFLPTWAAAETYTYQDGYSLGETEAGEMTGLSWGWIMGGVLGGSLLNVVGGGGVCALAYLHEPVPDSQTRKILERKPQTYSFGYLDGYQRVISQRNMRHAALGAGVGIAINTTVLVIFYLMQ